MPPIHVVFSADAQGNDIDRFDATGQSVATGVVDRDRQELTGLPSIAVKDNDTVALCPPNHLDER